MIGTTLLREVRLDLGRVGDPAAWPYSIPAVAALADGLELHPQVTCLVGENGTGKSTIAEAIAAKLDLDAEGGDTDLTFVERNAESPLHEALVLVRGARRPSMRYFLRAESFFNVARDVDASGGGRIRELALDGAQFVLATHSPLLLAYPEATIYELSESGIERVAYEQTDSYRLTRAFLENREGFLRRLFA